MTRAALQTNVNYVLSDPLTYGITQWETRSAFGTDSYTGATFRNDSTANTLVVNY